MPFSAPGLADDLTPDLLDRWNEEVLARFEQLDPSLSSRFFRLEAADPAAQRVPVTWFGDPAEPGFCLDATAARQLSDWGVRGRRALHNEYCEYAVVTASDGQGRLRPKRVQITTELPEYHLMLATHAPTRLREILTGILGTEPRWEELYGPGTTNPAQLGPMQRRVRFARQLTGHCGDPELASAGVPGSPVGSLNAVNALFMAHPINGLDDLIYIVLFGACPYARRTASGGLEPAGRDQIFRVNGTEALACRHADPAAALAAAGAAFQGRTVSFADPLGVYIHRFASDVFQFEGGPVPDPWIRWGRGAEGLRQRLEFGPGDDDPHFLDEITVASGAVDEPLTGGYEVARRVEVGPIAAVGGPTAVPEDEFVVLPDPPGPIRCRDAQICDSIKQMKKDFDLATERILPVAGPRGRQ
ncbi:hypothetical protein [Streptomyces sp. NPDC012888]|uniref:hypothetical protein n=1 Tax=Streptomyces sp. NPDC012888 TaxID=3364855 RepID=UPI00367F70F7